MLAGEVVVGRHIQLSVELRFEIVSFGVAANWTRCLLRLCAPSAGWQLKPPLARRRGPRQGRARAAAAKIERASLRRLGSGVGLVVRLVLILIVTGSYIVSLSFLCLYWL